MAAERALIALGTNAPFQGLSGSALLAAALHALEEAGARVLAVSRAWRTPAWPPSRQPDFVNAAAALDFGTRGPEEALALLLETEARFGRVRRERWARRTLDLDLIDHGGRVRAGSDPILPHPRALERAFVLLPILDIAPGWAPRAAAEAAPDYGQAAAVGAFWPAP